MLPPKLSIFEQRYEVIRERGCECAQCPLAIGTPAGPQPYGVIATDINGSGLGSIYDGIIVVGEIPSFNDKRGPLSGRARHNWKEALEKSGLNTSRLLVVPTVHCVPSNVLKKSDRAHAVQRCKPSLLEEISGHPNVPLLLMGQDAMQAVGIDAKITAVRGFVYDKDRCGNVGHPYIITNAATTVMFGNIYMWGTFIEDLRRFKRLIHGNLKPGLDPSMVKIHANEGDLQALLTRAGSRAISVDIETTAPAETPELGLDATRASLKTIAFGLPEYSCSFSWSDSDISTRLFASSILSERSRIKVFHNGPWFDLRVLDRYGLQINNWEDTRDLRRAISSTSRLSLGYLGSLYCDIHAWKLDDNNDKLASSNNLDELLLYNGYDTIVTARIYEAMRAGAGL